jgi:lipopolysaccharide biosynthesis glycosyltransferase
MKSKNIIVVQNVFDDLSKTEQSIKSIRFAAHRWESDFYEMSYFKNKNSHSFLFWDRIWAMESFKNFDKVLIVDPDVVINEESPNIFDLMEPTNDLCVVHDINRDRASTANFERISLIVSKLHNSIDIFQRKINNFSENTYLENYFNMGVFLYRPKSLSPIIQEMKELMFNDEELMKYLSFKECGDWFPAQNFTNAYLTHSNLNIKFLSKEWNWLSPDIDTEYNEEYFLGKMKPNIYHFTATDLAKERLKTYTKWKKNG